MPKILRSDLEPFAAISLVQLTKCLSRSVGCQIRNLLQKIICLQLHRAEVPDTSLDNRGYVVSIIYDTSYELRDGFTLSRYGFTPLSSHQVSRFDLYDI